VGFIAPMFLLGLLGLLAPWLLHRLNERNAPVQDFPSDQFLEQTNSMRARQKKLRYLRLLALRLLALALLCLLFAQPLFKRWNLLSGEVQQLHMLVVDQSFSMRAGERWPQAQRLFAEAVDEIPAQMPLQLIGVDGAAVPRVDRTQDRAAIQAGMQSLEPGYSTFEYATLMRQLSALAERQDLPVQVHLFTDMQANAMPVRLNDLRADTLSGLRIHNVSDVATANATVTANVIPVDDSRFSIEATVRRYGEVEQFGPQRVMLEAPGEDPLELPVAAEGDSAEVTFENLIWPNTDQALRYTVTLLPGDDLAADDSVELPVQAVLPAQVRILDFSANVTGSDAWLYLDTALKLDGSLNVTRVLPGNNESLESADMLIVLDDMTLEQGELPTPSDRVVRYMDNGGTVLYVLNRTERISAASRLIEATTHIDTVDETHPLSLDASAWRDVEFYVHQAVVPGTAEILLSTDSGLPVLLESSREKGKLLWLNAALNGSDNNLPISPVFVPFLHKLANYYLYYDRYPSTLNVGDNVKLGQSVQLLDPAGESLLKLSESVGGSVHVVKQPGIYTILDQLGEHPVLVSAAALESDTRVAPDSAIAAWESVITSADESIATSDDADEGASPNATSTNSLTGTDNAEQKAPLVSIVRWLLPLCAIIFLMETLFANYHLRVRRA